MGSFGIQFSNNFSRPKEALDIQDQLNEKVDGFFQKSLAYTSYYVMLFVSYAMITPETMDMAQNTIIGLFS